jgi:decaprenyl-phosphate phosphoribosyltransferase
MGAFYKFLNFVTVAYGETFIKLDYIKIARPDHWFKNVFVLPGIFLGLLVNQSTLGISEVLLICYGLFIVCLTASANYVINEIMDASSDKHHPKKKHRPIPSGRVKKSSAFLVWIGFLFLSLSLASTVNRKFLIVTIVFILQGLLYNIPPARLKDLPYLDVIAESVNNPIRLLLGWFLIITESFPTLSLVLAYWMIGAFFMASKRYAEFVLFNDRHRATAYRSSFRYYSKNKLLISMFFYACLFSFFMGIFLIRYRVELIFAIPNIVLVLAYYLKMSLMPDSPVQTPELLYKNRLFVGILLSCLSVIILFFFVDVPFVREIFAPVAPYYP